MKRIIFLSLLAFAACSDPIDPGSRSPITDYKNNYNGYAIDCSKRDSASFIVLNTTINGESAIGYLGFDVLLPNEPCFQNIIKGGFNATATHNSTYNTIWSCTFAGDNSAILMLYDIDGTGLNYRGIYKKNTDTVMDFKVAKIK